MAHLPASEESPGRLTAKLYMQRIGQRAPAEGGDDAYSVPASSNLTITHRQIQPVTQNGHRIQAQPEVNPGVALAPPANT